MTSLPEVAKRPCNECPWRRTAVPGWLGPVDAETWLAVAHSDEPIACHLTLVEDGKWEGARQCAGAAQFRTNVCKVPRDKAVAVADEPDEVSVFGSSSEFLEHHTGGGL